MLWKAIKFWNRFQVLYDKIIKFSSNLPELKNKIKESYDEINNNKLVNFKFSQDIKKSEEINTKLDSIEKEFKIYNNKIDDFNNLPNIQILNQDINYLLEESKIIKEQYDIIKDSNLCLEYLKIPIAKNEDIKKVLYEDEEIKLYQDYIYLKKAELMMILFHNLKLNRKLKIIH